MNLYYYLLIPLLTLLLVLLSRVSKRQSGTEEEIKIPYKYIIDNNEENISVYEFDARSTRSCNMEKYYYTNTILMDDDSEIIELVSLSKVKNSTFTYTNDIEVLNDILKQEGKLLEWMMTRIES